MARWRSTLGLIGTTTTVAVALSILDWTALANAFAELSAGPLLVAAGLCIATTLILAVRWAVLVSFDRHSGGEPFRDALVGNVFNLITPAAFGADAYRVAIARNYPGGRVRATSLVILERIFGVSGYAFAFLIAYAIAAARGPVTPLLGAAAACFAVIALAPLIALALTRAVASDLVEGFQSLLVRRIIDLAAHAANVPTSRLILVAALSFTGAGTWLAAVAMLTYDTDVKLAPETVAMIGVVTEFSRLLPISIQGIGTREATFTWLASEAGGRAPAAFAACATVYALQFILIGVLGLAARTYFDFRWMRRIG